LVRLAGHYGVQTEMVERLFQAYFLEGRDIGSIPELTELAVEIGLPPGEVVRFLQSEEEMASILQENSRAHRLGMSGVPSFVVNGRFAIAGAQEADIIARLLDLGSADTWQEEPVSHGELALA
jgi:predicted DsbA family dithiol-disulfide isomerase